MASHRNEPVWLLEQIVLTIHDDLLETHGGLYGLRDNGLFESASRAPAINGSMVKLKTCSTAQPRMDSASPRIMPFNDGNKRTAFQSMYTFLGLNGCDLDASEVDAVEVMVGVADGSVSEKELGAWLRKNSTKPRRKRKS